MGCGSSAEAQSPGSKSGKIIAYPQQVTSVTMTTSPNYVQNQSTIFQKSHISTEITQRQPLTSVEESITSTFQPNNDLSRNNNISSEVKMASFDKSEMLKYVSLENEINKIEGKNVVQTLRIKWQQVKTLDEEIKRLNEIHQKCIQKRIKEKSDVDNLTQTSIKNLIHDQIAYDSQLSKEQEEYLVALNTEEVARKDVETAKEQRGHLLVEVKQLNKEVESLQKLYKSQEDQLSVLFNGKYGSAEEFRLESELDLAQDRQSRINAAKQRWETAKLLMGQAYQQLAFVVQRWQYLPQIPIQNMQMRYNLVTEVRNYLVAVSTNMTNAQQYLPNISFPYCKPEEINTLIRATTNIYNDMNTFDRYNLAKKVYEATYQRAYALLQWFDTVIEKTILRDMDAANKDFSMKKRAMRVERVKLIKKKLEQFFTIDEVNAMNLDLDGNLTDALELERQLVSVTYPEKLSLDGDFQSNKGSENASPVKKNETAQPANNNQTPKDANNLQTSLQEASKSTAPAPLPLNELAPPPSQEALFGNINELKEQHERDLAEFRQAQELTKVRADQGLQEKLAERRSRKARKSEQESEIQQLLNESG